ncbi:MAG TPA: ferritin-like domain-containing protein [Solirubrobacterales bacterium]|nr:ferritin-like domain-containing protein [Solirubrobacterales bacterium]
MKAGSRIRRVIAANRITRGSAVRRALPLLAAALLATAAFGACGSSGDDSGDATAAAEQEADAEVLNEILSRQLAAVRAHRDSFPALHDRQNLAAARLFRAQEQEHADATLKALRGLGAEPEPEPEAIPADGLDTEPEFLLFLYELESATIEAETAAIGKLTDFAPRTMLAGTVANQAQHLAFLRGALSAPPLETMPSAFENGTVAAP